MPNLIDWTEWSKELETDVRQWEKQMDAMEPAVAVQTNHTFSQGFYLGSQHEAKKHWWYFVCGIGTGIVGMWLTM